MYTEKQMIRAPLEVAVTDSVASVGGSAALRCLVPPAAREHVSLTTWVSDDDVNVFPFTDIAANRSRFQAFPSGLLLVTGVTRADERRRFRCVVKDSLTGEKVDSAVWGKLIVTGPVCAGSLATFTHKCGAAAGDAQCGARSTDALTVLPKFLGEMVQEVDGTLVFRQASLHDSGKYVCIASNSLGQDRADRELVVTGLRPEFGRQTTQDPRIREA
ncbi:hypothetical protein IscW_ISCW023932 [Ixodes scapularis]|uniref:Ig-like domain-containing protein n=1 Tax=Ixodes scapularis TaxID=6945 RepID=B7QNB7_IXOSC|nr:hypothetical protein IscW_ISCW023932 [Ixodes scapularis]|eukprot:XP_002416422.1 hypothetical protein IscW_ISCW023932 [Ixodes scapularis]